MTRNHQLSDPIYVLFSVYATSTVPLFHILLVSHTSLINYYEKERLKPLKSMQNNSPHSIHSSGIICSSSVLSLQRHNLSYLIDTDDIHYGACCNMSQNTWGRSTETHRIVVPLTKWSLLQLLRTGTQMACSRIGIINTSPISLIRSNHCIKLSPRI